ncbi:MAG: hypothetical protein ACC618_00810 [Patescibacteria group bacterium]
MSGCCSDNNSEKKEKEEKKTTGQEPQKSFVGRLLYNTGKKDFEKNKGKSKGGGCC